MNPATPGPPSTVSLEADILAVRAPWLNFHVLRGADGLYLLDTGFIGGPILLRRALERRGWAREPIRGVIITHGHLDHILNVAPVSRSAWIAAPRLDADHYAGRPSYTGWARVTGILESIGRPLLRFRPFMPDRWIDPGDFIDVWDGLRAVHLPGHTHGHMGFYCESRRLLFSGDLFASSRGVARIPPRIFNSAPEQIPGSVAAALDLNLAGIIPNHCDHAPPSEHLARLRALHLRELRND